jgi:predicted RNA-binding protein with PUA-like domain
VRHFDSLLSLDALRDNFSPEELGVVKRGNRLSILPVSSSSAEQLFALLESA